MAEEKALVPLYEQQVSFYGDDITAALVEVDRHEQIYVPLRPICDFLELSWAGQLERIKRDGILNGETRFVRMTRTNRGGNPEVVCLPLKLLNGWLFGVDTARIKDPVKRERVLLYKKECYDILYEAFQNRALSSEEENDSDLAGLVEIQKMGLAIAEMARQQIESEKRLKNLNVRLNNAAVFMRDIDQRLTTVEKKLKPGGEIISEEQAAVVQVKVRELGQVLERQDGSKKHYGEIYIKLYSMFKVTKYNLLKAEQYADVISFLDRWREEAELKKE